MSATRDSRWMLVPDPQMREILRDILRRLDALDLNAGDLAIPDRSVTQAKLANNSVGSAQIIADAVGTGEIAAGAVGPSELAADAVTTAAIAAAQVTKTKLAGGFLGATCIAGGVAGNHAVTGISAADQLVLVAQLNRDAAAANIDLTSLTSQFTISAANTINNAAGTDTTGDALMVLWLDLT